MEKVLLIAALVGFAWFCLMSALWVIRKFQSGLSSRKLWVASVVCAWLGVALYVFAPGRDDWKGIITIILAASVISAGHLYFKTFQFLTLRHRHFWRYGIAILGFAIFCFDTAYALHGNTIPLKQTLGITAELFFLWWMFGFDFDFGKFNEDEDARNIIPATLFVALLIGVSQYTKQNGDFFIALLVGLLFVFGIWCIFAVFINGVGRLLASGSSGDGNNWRNAGDRDSDPDNHIWVGNPSHDD